MGNRAIITTEARELGVYLHWNGGRDSVEAFLKYCDLQGFRSPDSDCYGWARLCEVIGNYFPDGLCVGIDRYTTDGQMNPGDNGIYIIKGWEIVDRVYPYEDFTDYDEQREYPLLDMLLSIDNTMPERMRLGEKKIREAMGEPLDEPSGDRLVYAAKTYLQSSGYKDIWSGFEAGGFKVDFIAEDLKDGCLVFIVVRQGLEHYEADREAFEAMACEYFAKADRPTTRFRLDVLNVRAVSEDRAMLRCERDVLGSK